MRNPKSRFFISERVVNLLTYALLILTILSVFGLKIDLWRYFSSNSKLRTNSEKISLLLGQIEEVKLSDDAYATYSRNPACRFWDCFNIYRCNSGRNERLKVYVYPLHMYTDASGDKVAAPLSREFYEILKAIIDSPFYTSNANEACLFIPSLDLLNLKRVEPMLVNQALANLAYWNNGENHIIFNMVATDQLLQNTTNSVNTDKAIIMSGSFDSWTYRDGFDISLPVLSPFIHNVSVNTDLESKKILLIIAQLNILPKHKKILRELAEDQGVNEVLMLEDCNDKKHMAQPDVRCSTSSLRSAFQYPHVLAKGTFCLLSRSINLGQPDLLEMLALNCIPVIAIDNYVLPFEEVLDWSTISLRVQENDLRSLHERLSLVTATRILELQTRGKAFYEKFFKDIPTFTLKTLEILEWRIMQKAYTKRQWNALSSNARFDRNPLFLPMIAPKSQGFTAVILTYDRVNSLFTLIQKLALVPSLQCILVIWNNQDKPPPHLSTYPRISKPLKVIQTRANKLSNRFYPYLEIETEAVLSIDDDIVMLTTDELEFGFEVWREFPDRIVGFPSRINLWNNLTNSWYYESEWTNQISMVLTGAAFYHKYWNHMYTYSMPGDIKDWVDEHMNCEDIAMNFLVANVSNKAPIKVTPRKKFKCPKCVNTEMLSADLNHMRERSACINRFAKIYGHMPLRSVEFRADPVLFKDNFPEKLKRFNNIGTL